MNKIITDKEIFETKLPSENDIRLRILYLYQFLLTLSDEEHPLKTNQIIQLMGEKHGIYMHRTTVYSDIALLKAAGFDIVCIRKQAWHYYIADRTFSIPELKLLIDAVQASKFITESKSEVLIGKLASLTSEENAKQLRRTMHTTNKVKSENEKGYYIVDAINEAMNAGAKISFQYFDYNVKKKKVLKNDGKPYTVSPYDLIWDGDNYYLAGYCDERDGVRVFRVDRITAQPKLLTEPMHSRPRTYSVDKYTQEVFRMFDTQQTENVTLLCEQSTMKSFIDKFGSRIRTKALDNDHFQITVKACVGPTFYSWVFGFGGKIVILSPKNIIEEYNTMLRNALQSSNTDSIYT